MDRRANEVDRLPIRPARPANAGARRTQMLSNGRAGVFSYAQWMPPTLPVCRSGALEAQ
jgi:hypothetical protein